MACSPRCGQDLLGLGATGGPWQSTQNWYIVNNQPSITLPNPFGSAVQGFDGVQSINAIDPAFPSRAQPAVECSVGRQIWQTAIDVAYVGHQG